MMRPAAILSAFLMAGVSLRADDLEVYPDPRGDAVVRRTDLGLIGPLNPLGRMPDLLSISVCGWESPTPYSNPYSGTVVDGETAELMRLQIVFDGVINPPGPVELATFNPFQYGPSPVYGSVEFNVDRDDDTGGEFTSAAKQRYFANVGRFGRMPGRSNGAARGVRWGVEVDGDVETAPQFERDATDFLFSLCGCWSITVLEEGGNLNGMFEAGETWRVRGRFLQRAGGYRLASYMGGGSAAGLYDPLMPALWSHNVTTNETTVTLVYPLTMLGAAQLATQPPNPVVAQAPNASVLDHWSLFEGMKDVVLGATTLSLTPPTTYFAARWSGRSDATLREYQDPTRWRVQAIFGTSYTAPIEGARHVWTDTGGEEDAHGDQNHDDLVNSADRMVVRGGIAQWDGGPLDGDGAVNGTVLVANPGPNFCAYDILGDQAVNFRDSIWYCPADTTDDLVLNVSDFSMFLQLYAMADALADADRDGRITVLDFTAFLQRYALGCP
jgi:hypothetical protein